MPRKVVLEFEFGAPGSAKTTTEPFAVYDVAEEVPRIVSRIQKVVADPNRFVEDEFLSEELRVVALRVLDANDWREVARFSNMSVAVSAFEAGKVK